MFTDRTTIRAPKKLVSNADWPAVAAPPIPFAKALEAQPSAEYNRALLAAGLPLDANLAEHKDHLTAPTARMLFNYACLCEDKQLETFVHDNTGTVKLLTIDLKDSSHRCLQWITSGVMQYCPAYQVVDCQYAQAPNCCYGYLLLGKCPYTHPYADRTKPLTAAPPCPCKLHIRCWNRDKPDQPPVLAKCQRFESLILLTSAQRDATPAPILPATYEALEKDIVQQLSTFMQAQYLSMANQQRHWTYREGQAGTRDRSRVFAQQVPTQQRPAEPYSNKRHRDDRR